METRFFIIGLVLMAFCLEAGAQEKKWTLEDCIGYALDRNITVRKADLTIKQDEINLDQSKANILPSVAGSVSQDFSWSKRINSAGTDYGSMKGSSGTSFGLSSGMTLFNGNRLKNEIEQAKLNLLYGQYYSESVKESIELNILDAYLAILFAYENVKNAEDQIASTTEQLAFAEARLEIGVISRSDYLQIKSELASEKSTLADAKSTLAIARVDLMQLMELPVDENFDIVRPDLTEHLEVTVTARALDVYSQSLEIRPQIKQYASFVESARLDEKIAKADFLPSLSLGASLTTGANSPLYLFNYAEQLKNKITPSVGFTLSIPVFQNKQARNNLKLAKISTNDAELDEINTKNILRKDIEQAVVNVETAISQYNANIEAYESAEESYNVAAEKFELGLINTVDFLSIRTDFITAESNLLQSKYNLIFSNRILDFYKGMPITLSGN